MSCSWRPTIIVPADGWIAANSDTYPDEDCAVWRPSGPPEWAGIARGLFQFMPATRPNRLAWNRAAVAAELARSLPASDAGTGRLDDWVQYWFWFPQLFHVRNESAETVTLSTMTVHARERRCAPFEVDVLAGQEAEVGPWWGRGASTLRVQVYGATPGPGGALTVPAGVDVRVTAPSRADPGLVHYDDACSAPAVVVV